jgi:hypothetical protein
VKNQNIFLIFYLFIALLSSTPATALCIKNTQIKPSNDDTLVTESNTTQPTTQAASNNLIANLVGPQLYRYLLQSDQFITLQGIIEDYWKS